VITLGFNARLFKVVVEHNRIAALGNSTLEDQVLQDSIGRLPINKSNAKHRSILCRTIINFFFILPLSLDSELSHQLGKAMLLSLMSSQLLSTTISFPAIVRTADPETMVSDTVMDGLNVTLEVTGSGEGLGAERPGTGSALDSWNGWGPRECRNAAKVVGPSLHFSWLNVPECLWLCGPCIIIDEVHLILEVLRR
jgi:hypothetical protein